MTGGEISRNTAYNGGGIDVYALKGTDTYTNCYLDGVTISGNHAYSEGGAVFLPSGNYLSLMNCHISENTDSLGSDVCSKASLYLYGSTSIGVCYSTFVNPVYLNSDISGKTKFIPNAYTTGTQVISALSGTLTKEMIDCFSIDDTKYFIGSEGKLETTSAGGAITTEDHTCLFELDKSTVTAGVETTLNVTATITTNGVQESVAAANLNWVTVKVYCGSYEVTSSNVPGLSVSNGVVTIPAAMPEDSYKLYVSGIYTCPNGCQKAFSGDFPFTVE